MEGAGNRGVQVREVEKQNDERLYLEEFKLYETRSKFYIIGTDKNKSRYRVLKINRIDPHELDIWEDNTDYSAGDRKDLLKMLRHGNHSSGGLKRVVKFYGIIGFVKFLGPYYMILITERKEIGSIFGHNVYAVGKSEMISISSTGEGVPSELLYSENRYKKLLCSVDLTKDFFFSYSYHVMKSLQKNMRDSLTANDSLAYDYMFVWNAFLTRGIRNILQSTTWTVALVHGFFKQEKFSLSGKEFKLTLVARRSRHYAGTRYLKRGVDDKGRVANDVETEQIVSEDVPGAWPVRLTSVVQNRGSIPLFWSQETSRLNLRPDIILQKKDQNYEVTKLHFNNLVRRYENPIIIFSLIKKHEKTPRESILHNEFAKAINFINKDLSKENRLKFYHWDLNKLYARKENVLLLLARLAAHALSLTNFFYCELNSSLTPGDPLTLPDIECQKRSVGNNRNGLPEDDLESAYGSAKQCKFQRGVLRTNCIDCLDRTNVAQFAYGLAAFGQQLYALDLIEDTKIDLDTQLAQSLMTFYEEMGDTLALQYGGSGAHNKIFSENRGQLKAATQSMEFFRNLQRYWSNAYLDGQKQDAINVFLGNFRPQLGNPALWEDNSDQHFKLRRLSSFTDEISRPLKRSLSAEIVLHEINNIRTLISSSEPVEIVNPELPDSMARDGEEKILDAPLEWSLFGSESPHPREGK